MAASKRQPREQAPLFEELFMTYRGQAVNEVIFAIGGKAPLTEARGEIGSALEQGQMVDLVIRAQVTSHDYKLKPSGIMAVCVLDVFDVKFAEGQATLMTRKGAKQAGRADAAKDVTDTLDMDTPEGNYDNVTPLRPDDARATAEGMAAADDIPEEA